MQNPPVFLVIGPPKHGKTEVRKILADITHMKGISTSEIIYRYLALRRNVSIESLKEIPKEELRPALIEAGDYLVGKIDSLAEPAVNAELDAILYRIPSALIRTPYMSGYNIIDGVRRIAEIEEARSRLDWNGVRSVVVYVKNPGAPTVSDNTEVTETHADVVIVNDGTIEDLRAKLLAMLESIFGKQDELDADIPVVEAPPPAAVAPAVASHSNEL